MAAPHPLPSLDDAKREARLRARAARRGCDPALGRRLADHLLRDAPPPPGAVVGGFWPLPEEIDIRFLLVDLHHAGHVIVLPQTPPAGQPLRFRQWRPKVTMLPGRFGTHHPDGPETRPDWLLVPLLAFDDQGRRLGYGGGYYDRTLAELSTIPAIGCAFSAQRMIELPAGPRDIRLSRVATELGVLTCQENDRHGAPVHRSER